MSSAARVLSAFVAFSAFSASPGTVLAQPATPRGASILTTPLPRPEFLRGIYLNAWAAGSSSRLDGLIGLAGRTEVNAFVIDVKDASGYVSYSSAVPMAREVGATDELRIRDVRGLLARLETEGIWPIARIVVFQDPLLARARPELAVRDSLGDPWVDGAGDLWLNPWDHRVWDYHVALAREAVELGFREIQWDYVRFPDRPAEEMAALVFPGADGRERPLVIREFLQHARLGLEDLGVPMTADVFGVTVSHDLVAAIGQRWIDFFDVVDAALPMVYPSHYWEGAFGYLDPNAHPYEIVFAAMDAARKRMDEGAGKGEPVGRVIPWLQDFTLGDPAYGPDEVRAQIRAASDAGIHEWMLWNSRSTYTEAALTPN